MRRWILALCCMLMLCAAVFAADARVSTLRYELEVAQDGSCEVTLTAVVDFSEAPEALRIPLGKNASSVRCSGWTFSTERVNGVICLRIGDCDAFSGTQTFRVQYRLTGCVEQSTERQTFSVLLPGVGWEYPIEVYELSANFPAEITHLPAWSSGYHGEAIDNELTVVCDGSTLTARSNCVLQDRETMQLTLAFDDGSFALSQTSDWSAESFLWVFYILLILCPLYWLLRLKNPLLIPKRAGSVTMEATAGETPCRLYGSEPDLAAMLVHWANLGYLKFHIKKSGRVSIIPQMDMGNERKASERKLFHSLFGKDAQRTLSADADRIAFAERHGARFVRASWLRRNYRSDSGNPAILRLLGLADGTIACLYAADCCIGAVGAARWVLLALLAVLLTALCALVQQAGKLALHRGKTAWKLGGLCAAIVLWVTASRVDCTAVMLPNLLLQLFCGCATCFGGRRSSEGMDSLRELLGLRRFLLFGTNRELSRLFERDRQAFFRLLPFAEQLGVGAVLAFRMRRFRVGLCPWLTADRGVPTTAEEFYRFYAALLRSLRTPKKAQKRLPVSAGRGRR